MAGFIDKALGAVGLARKSLAYPTPEILALFGATATASGRSVTAETAMRVPTVAACVRAISEAAGTLPCKINRRLVGGGKEVASDHAAYALVHDDANDWTSAAKFREQLTIDALLHGHGVAYTNRADGKPVEFIRLDPRGTTVELKPDGEPQFKYTAGAVVKTYAYSDILYIPATSIDGIKGVAPIHSGREAIGLAAVLEEHAAKLFGNSARPSGVLKLPNKLSEEASGRLVKSWADAHGGGKSGGTAVLEEGADWQAITLDPVTSQFDQMRAAQVSEICRIFRVPPIFVQDYGRMTWSNSESANLLFLQHCLLPWLRTWEAAYRRVLLTKEQRAEYTIDFVVDDLLRADTAVRVEAYSKMITARILNPNEVRAMDNLPPYVGGEVYANPAITAANDNAPPASEAAA